MRLVNPVDYNGELRGSFAVEGTHDGTCDDGSRRLVDNINAYRCTFDNLIADPCFAMKDGREVYCLPAPWEAAGVLLELEEPVKFDPAFRAPPAASGPDWPWALEVADPRVAERRWHCTLAAGMGAEIAGHRVSWWCDRGESSWEAAAVGTLVREPGPVWRVLFYDPDEPDLIEASVVKVWN